LSTPTGLRFNADSTQLCVADRNNDRVSLFRVADGGFVRHLATGLRAPFDVEEVEGGWLVACCHSDSVEFVSGDGGGVLASLSGRDKGHVFRPVALTVVPQLGLVVHVILNDDTYWLKVSGPIATPLLSFAAVVLERGSCLCDLLSMFAVLRPT
jgi:hypothetical protein